MQLTTAALTFLVDLKVVLASGRAASALEVDHEVPDGTPLRSKPCAREKLAKTLQSIPEQR